MISTEQDLVNTVTSLTLMVVIALAVRQDLVEHRISNLLTFAALAAGLSMNALSSGLDGFANALAGAGVGLACLLPLYLAKGMGAGDVKLMTAAGAFLGPSNALLAAFLSLAFGAVLAIAVVIWRVLGSRVATAGASGFPGAPGEAKPTLSQVRKERFPYAMAIGLGVIVTLWQRGMLEALLRVIATP